jgi:hypothetical protein
MRAKRKDPQWWSKEYDSAWQRVKQAFRRDWEQTKHDFGGKAADLNQNVDDTVGQAAGSRPIPPAGEPNFEEYEPAFRFGYGARKHYGSRYPTWNESLEKELRTEFGDEDWKRNEPAIRRGWDYDDMTKEMSKSSGRILEKDR